MENIPSTSDGRYAYNGEQDLKVGTIISLDCVTAAAQPSTSSAVAAQPTTQYVDDAIHLLISNSDITPANAIHFNTKLRSHLIQLRTQLEQLRDQCQQRYQANQKKIDETHNTKICRIVKGKFNSFYFTGAPYFKNRSYFAASPNTDYLHRKNELRELFPMDLTTLNTWTSNDKTLLILGVKQQMITNLKISDRYVDIAELNRKPIARVNEMVDHFQFKINWNKIVFDVMKERHSASECIAMWNVCLHPDLRRAPWSSIEDAQLLQACERFDYQNWAAIAMEVPYRSSFQCFLRYEVALSEKNQVKNTRWTPDEDNLLLRLIDKFRIGQTIPWIKIAEKMKNRNQTQVYQRWLYTVNPDIKKGRFTKEEDCILMAAVVQYGNRISDLPPNLLPGRTQQQLRHRYNNVLKLSGTLSDWTLEEDQKLWEFAEQKGAVWSEIAKTIGNHTRQSCRQRYLTLKKYLAKDPKNTLESAPRKKRNRENAVSADNWFECYVKQLNGGRPSNAVLPFTQESDNGYYNKLTQIKKKYFDFFRTSFNYTYGVPNNFQPNTNSFILLSNLLNFNPMSVEELPELTSLSECERTLMGFQGFNPITKHKPIQFIPPNISTLLLARGLCIAFHPYRVVSSTKGRRRHAIKQHSTAFSLFKERLTTMIILPLLLSKLKYNTSQRQQEIPSEGLEEEQSEEYILDDDPDELNNYVDVRTKLDNSFQCRIKLGNVTAENGGTAGTCKRFLELEGESSNSSDGLLLKKPKFDESV